MTKDVTAQVAMCALALQVRENSNIIRERYESILTPYTKRMADD